jgi:hypothetical protein
MAICFLIDSPSGRPGSAAARFARFREIPLLRSGEAASLPSQAPPNSLIAIGGSHFQALSPHEKKHLASLTGDGATLYIRGLPKHRASIDLAPFAPLELPIAPEHRASGYRLGASRMLPAALAGEEIAGGLFEAPGVERRSAQAFEDLVLVRHLDNVERTAVFAIRYGQGCAIYDLHGADDENGDLPLLARMANRHYRHQEIGALIAANRASGIDHSRPPPFNLVIDDRPINYDHFNAAAISAFLRHISEMCPGAHTDFAWTPCHTSVSRVYVQAMKRFPTGFVWHGLFRHVDHRMLLCPEEEYAKGRQMVERLERRFAIRFQPLMIFPFERSAERQFPLLAKSGFLASVEEPHHPSCSEPDIPAYMNDALPARVDPNSGLMVLYRYPATSLTRERMLAMASLGLPIIASAHPEEVGLKRFSRFVDRGGHASHLDEILKFASAKRLPSRSLEEIVREIRQLDSKADRNDGEFRAAVAP